MDEEFKLCWKNFQDNIASGFQNLYDRGDLVDVTLACDGKLLHAHKIVLAICSPYFQEIFLTNPCKHPIIILKDVTFNIMCELLEFMYQGVVNVKHAELQSFMKIGQLLQIKGLATNSTSSTTSTSSEKSTSQTHNPEESNRTTESNVSISETTPASDKSEGVNDAPANPTLNTTCKQTTNSSLNRSRSPSISSTPSNPSGLAQQQPNIKTEYSPSLSHGAPYHVTNIALKRQADFSGTESSSPLFAKKQFRRSIASASASANDQNSDLSDANESAQGMDSMSNEDFLLPTISMVESRYDLHNIKRDHLSIERDYRDNASAAAAAAAAASLRNTFGAPFGFDYNLYKNNSNASSGGGNSSNSTQQAEYPNELHMPNDYSKNFGNHMEIPPIAPGEHWFQGNLEFMLSQRGKPLLVHDGHTFGIQYVRKDKKYWQCNLSRKYNCKARVTTTETGDIIVTNNEHCHTEIRQHLRKDYQRQKVMMNALINLSTNRLAENLRRQHQQQQQQQHSNSLTNSLNHLQQSLSSPQCTSSIGGIAPLAAHSATSNATASMQRLLELGKFSPEHTNLLSALQKHQENNDNEENNEPLDCGIRSAVNISDEIKNELPQDSNGMLKKHVEANMERTAVDSEEVSENLTPSHA